MYLRSCLIPARSCHHSDPITLQRLACSLRMWMLRGCSDRRQTAGREAQRRPFGHRPGRASLLLWKAWSGLALLNIGDWRRKWTGDEIAGITSHSWRYERKEGLAIRGVCLSLRLVLWLVTVDSSELASLMAAFRGRSPACSHSFKRPALKFSLHNTGSNLLFGTMVFIAFMLDVMAFQQEKITVLNNACDNL